MASFIFGKLGFLGLVKAVVLRQTPSRTYSGRLNTPTEENSVCTFQVSDGGLTSDTGDSSDMNEGVSFYTNRADFGNGITVRLYNPATPGIHTSKAFCGYTSESTVRFGAWYTGTFSLLSPGDYTYYATCNEVGVHGISWTGTYTHVAGAHSTLLLTY